MPAAPEQQRTSGCQRPSRRRRLAACPAELARTACACNYVVSTKHRRTIPNCCRWAHSMTIASDGPRRDSKGRHVAPVPQHHVALRPVRVQLQPDAGSVAHARKSSKSMRPSPLRSKPLGAGLKPSTGSTLSSTSSACLRAGSGGLSSRHEYCAPGSCDCILASRLTQSERKGGHAGRLRRCTSDQYVPRTGGGRT